MAKLQIAVLGASKIGRFHVRELLRAGANVPAILGSSAGSVAQTAASLYVDFGVRPNSYVELEKLIATEHLDAVSVCTPPEMHHAQVKMCIEAGLHVLCEKPVVCNSLADNYRETRELALLAEKKGRILTVNTQWPSILKYIKDRTELMPLRSFAMETQPSGKGIDMLTEQLSHSNSVLVALMPHGEAVDISVTKHSAEFFDVNFKYRNQSTECVVHYRYVHKEDRPRKVIFKFNDIEFRRELGEEYQQRLVSGNATMEIEDPFRASIGRFVGAIEGKTSPLVSINELLENAALQDRIVGVYPTTP